MLFLYLTQSKTIKFYDDIKLSPHCLLNNREGRTLNNREGRTQIPHG